MEPRTCDVCSTRYVPLRSSSRYCSPRCRKRAQRNGQARAASQTALPVDPATTTPTPPPGAVHAAVLAELERDSRADTALGKAALALALRVDAGEGETGSSLASLSRELRAVLADLRASAPPQQDALDQLMAKRREKLARGAG